MSIPALILLVAQWQHERPFAAQIHEAEALRLAGQSARAEAILRDAVKSGEGAIGEQGTVANNLASLLARRSMTPPEDPPSSSTPPPGAGDGITLPRLSQRDLAMEATVRFTAGGMPIEPMQARLPGAGTVVFKRAALNQNNETVLETEWRIVMSGRAA